MNANIKNQMMLLMALANVVDSKAPHLVGSITFAPFSGAILLLARTKDIASEALTVVGQHMGAGVTKQLMPLVGDSGDLDNDTAEVVVEIISEAVSPLKIKTPTMGFMDRIGIVIDFGGTSIPGEILEEILSALATAGGCSGKFQRFLINTPDKVLVVETNTPQITPTISEIADPVRSRMSKITDDNISDLRILLNTTLTVEDFLEKIDTLGGTDA
jgi:hypothetical protein